jgi:hypothetical protein
MILTTLAEVTTISILVVQVVNTLPAAVQVQTQTLVLVVPVLQLVVETILFLPVKVQDVVVGIGVVQRRTLVEILVEGRSVRLAMSVMNQQLLQLQQVFP